MVKRKYKYLVCGKSDNGVWFSSKDKNECIEWLETCIFKANEPPTKFYIRKERLTY